MRYYLVAGEASGDLHGSNLMREIKSGDPTAEFRFIGGDLMAAQGGLQFAHYKDRAFMGLAEVIANLGTIRRALKAAKKDIGEWNPDALILVDNPGFNMRIAAFAKSTGIPVHYYIAPKVWAWNTGRVRKIKWAVDHLYCILPFEKEFFSQHGVEVDYVGNPIMDAITGFTTDENFLQKHGIKKPFIALLPGSRPSEISQLLPGMLEVQNEFPEHTFVLCAAANHSEDFFRKLAGNKEIKIVFDETYNALQHADAAIVASGTATLETALFRVPQVVVYRVAAFTYFVGRMLIQVKLISLVNLILGKKAVEELIQGDFNKVNLTVALRQVLGEGRQQMLNDYSVLAEKVGGPGASARAATLITERTLLKSGDR